MGESHPYSRFLGGCSALRPRCSGNLIPHTLPWKRSGAFIVGCPPLMGVDVSRVGPCKRRLVAGFSSSFTLGSSWAVTHAVLAPLRVVNTCLGDCSFTAGLRRSRFASIRARVLHEAEGRDGRDRNCMIRERGEDGRRCKFNLERGWSVSAASVLRSILKSI